MKLDVGCGWNPQGDVNVDLFLNRPIRGHEAEQTRYVNHKAYAKKKISNLVCAHCAHLPFRDNTFSHVVCNHLLEHTGVDAVATSNELVRVANGTVLVTVPACLSWSATSLLHDKVFTRQSLEHLFSGCVAKACFTRFDWKHVNWPFLLMRRIASKYFRGKVPCPIPTEIRCEAWKP